MLSSFFLILLVSLEIHLHGIGSLVFICMCSNFLICLYSDGHPVISDYSRAPLSTDSVLAVSVICGLKRAENKLWN
jgi:hypothetical protein